MPSLLFISCFLVVGAVHAFAPSHISVSSTTTCTQLYGTNPLANLFGQQQQQQQSNKNNIRIHIPATNVKVGALRFLLNIFLVGEQNQPTPNAWLTRQTDDNHLQTYFHDGTGMLALEITEHVLQITRHGETPSMQFQLQESLLLHKILTELEPVAYDESVAPTDRLLQINETAIDDARAQLPARAET